MPSILSALRMGFVKEAAAMLQHPHDCCNLLLIWNICNACAWRKGRGEDFSFATELQVLASVVTSRPADSLVEPGSMTPVHVCCVL